MEFINELSANPYFIIPVTSILVLLAIYFTWPILSVKLSELALRKKDSINNYLDLMYVEIDDRRLTILLYLVSYGLGAVGFLLLFPNLTAGLIFGLILTAIGLVAPEKIIESMYHKRCKVVVNQMVDGMTILANGVKAGLSVTQSMERVTENLKGPLPQEFSMALNKIRLGMTVEDALIELGERVPEADIQMFVTSVIILKETGGNLAETFETINAVIRERLKLEKKIDAMTSQGVAQGMIMSCMPFVILAMLYVMDKEMIQPLFSTTTGIMALGAVIVLVILGSLMIKKIVTIKV